MTIMATSAAVNARWNLKDLEIRTYSVENALRPLAIQVTTLSNMKNSKKKGRGKSKRAKVLILTVEKATEKFIEKGMQIAEENSEVKEQMLAAVEEVKLAGMYVNLIMIEIFKHY